MEKTELFKQVNDRWRAQLLSPMTVEDFIMALSSLEIRGIFETAGNQIKLGKNIKYYTEVKTDERRNESNQGSN